MASSPTFYDLCCELVEDHYGDFYRTIFESVAGVRLTALQVSQICHVSLRQAKAGLAGLIQLRLIYYNTPKDAATLYYANVTNAYNILRAGKLIEAARECHGEAAAFIIASACDLGFATISELRDRVVSSEILTQHEDAVSLEKLVERLLADRYLIFLRKAHLGEAHDERRDVELKLLSPAAIAKLTGSKAKLDHESKVRAGYDELISTKTSESGFVNERFLSSQNRNTKNVKSLNGYSAKSSALVQPNYYKVVALAQSDLVRDCAEKVHGARAAAVLQCAVQRLAIPDTWSKSTHPLTHEINVYSLLEDVNAHRRRNTASKSFEDKVPNGMVNGHHDEDSLDLSIDDVEGELVLITESSFDFLENMGTSTWQVQKEILDQWTHKEEILRVMNSKLDQPAPRILRILIEKGKLEEKTLQEIGLLGAKELRQSLSLLKQIGYLDLQEVPRNPTRQPNHTIFLWSYEQDRVTSLVLESVYTAMIRLFQLLKKERQQIASTIAKVEREDVRGREQEILGAAEYTVLNRFRRTECWVWAEILRLDSTVAVLRDT